MQLSSFTITDFQSYRTQQELRLDPHITILAGRNNVGKSALLRALHIPASMQPGQRAEFTLSPECHLHYAWTFTHDELVNTFPDIETGLRAVGITGPRETYELRATLVAYRHMPELPSAETNAGPDFQLGNGLTLLHTDLAGTQLSLAPARARVTNALIQVLWWDQVATNVGSLPWLALAEHWVTFLRSKIGGSYYIHPRRTAESKDVAAAGQLEPDGGNLTQVLGTPHSNEPRTTFRELEAFMRSAFPEISSIDVRLDGNPLMWTIHVVYGEPPEELSVPLKYCGTGIEQMLMLATAILTAKTRRLFLIDEPHAFLHPSAERSLLRLIQDHTQHQYVIATHSGVFLNAVPLDHVRLITIDGAGSHINDARHASDILTAVGVTAAHLWSADAVFWIEGPSDVKAVQQVVARAPELRDVSIRVLAMPDWIRSLAASEKKAALTVAFCEAVCAAVAPFKVPALFLFDADEKQDDLKVRVEAATGGHARFLPVRELENLLLVPAAVQQVLADLCSKLGMSAPSVEEVGAELDRLLGDTATRNLYKTDPGHADAMRVVGSALLEQVWWTWATTTYDKVAYGTELVKAVAVHAPEKLEPLRSLLREVAEMARASRVSV